MPQRGRRGLGDGFLVGIVIKIRVRVWETGFGPKSIAEQEVERIVERIGHGKKE